MTTEVVKPWRPKVHYRIHKTSSCVPILGQTNPVHSTPNYFSTIHLIIIHPLTSWSSQRSLSLWLSHQWPKHIRALQIRAMFPAHYIFNDFIILIIFRDKYKLRMYSCAVFSNLPSPRSCSVQIPCSTPCSQTLSVCPVSLMSETKFHTSTEPQSELRSCIVWFLCFSTADKKTECSRLNGSKHYQNSVSSEFLSELNFDLLQSFRIIWTVTHCQFLYLSFDLHSGDKTAIYT
jgi:hypothetical protein